MKRILLSGVIGIAAACVSASAFARADVGVYFGVPGPVIETPPPVVYAPPPVYYEPAPAYYYGPYYDDYRYRRWHDNGWHRGWRHHHHHGGED